MGGDHAAQLAYVIRYREMGDEAKAHAVVLEAMCAKMFKETHAREEQRRLMDELEVKRLAVFTPAGRDAKLRALFHTFDLDGNGMVDKDESGEIDEDEFVSIFIQNLQSKDDKVFDKMVNTYAARATIAGEYVLRGN